MKKPFSILLFGLIASILITLSTQAQTVNDIPLKDIDVEYVQIVGTSKLMSTKLTIEIDFGQENKYWSNKDTQILDENKKKVVFNSMVDALNYMTSHHYEFVQAYAVSEGSGKGSVYHYLLRKKK